jgi:hypothetical protein
MKQTQIHHKLPRSRGGTDHPSNLVELTLYEHAEVHALDFINGGVHFDMRNPFWPVLQAENPELAEKVLIENRRRMSEKGKQIGVKHKEKIRARAKIIGHRSKNEGFGIFAPGMNVLGGQISGRRNAESGHCARIAHLGGIETGHQAAERLNSQKWQCTVTGKVSTPGPLTTYQKARGIDPSNRIQII